jgi:hypothetical protein
MNDKPPEPNRYKSRTQLNPSKESRIFQLGYGAQNIFVGTVLSGVGRNQAYMGFDKPIISHQRHRTAYGSQLRTMADFKGGESAVE